MGSLGLRVTRLSQRRILSAKWSRRGDYILANTRQLVISTSKHNNRMADDPPTPHEESYEDALGRQSCDLSTAMELMVFNSETMECIGVFDGHFAFTTKESPFLIFPDEWQETDFLASGGEDHNVYIWHQRHRRMLQKLTGHSDAVNAVSWNGSGLLASASDDQTVIIWKTIGRISHPRTEALVLPR